uniref:Uncharacterized protein n=1 Tax=Glossina palpalis gambiensis TaxID=67801 RepID=A0A1B0APL3_9MUSC
MEIPSKILRKYSKNDSIIDTILRHNSIKALDMMGEFSTIASHNERPSAMRYTRQGSLTSVLNTITLCWNGRIFSGISRVAFTICSSITVTSFHMLRAVAARSAWHTINSGDAGSTSMIN